MNVVAYFESLLARHGDSPCSLDWSEAGQRVRFRVLREIGIASNGSVLDVGCGLGHFHWDLAANGFTGSYVGVDASEAMIEAAQRVIPPTEPAKFVVVDALKGDLLLAADYVVSSGMLNVEEWPNEANMRLLLRRCFEACKIGAAVNMLSNRAPRQRPDRHYYDPTIMLQEALRITPRVTLRHDYKDNDFTLYLRKTS